MDLRLAYARNMAAWQEWQMGALGLECHRADSIWSWPQRGPGMHLTAVTISEGTKEAKEEQLAVVERLVELRPNDKLSVMDSWMDLDLTHLGFELDGHSPLYVRPPGPLPATDIPPELEMTDVSSPAALQDFELASFQAFEASGAHTIGRWHHEASLGDPDMRYFSGRVGGKTVSVSIGCVSDGVVEVYGVATLPQHRRRGYGAAMTWACLQMAPTLQAVLQPSKQARSMYRRMGFVEAGETRDWLRKATT